MVFGFCVGAIFTAFLYRFLAVYNRLALISRPWFVVILLLVHLLATVPVTATFVLSGLDGTYGIESLELVRKLILKENARNSLFQVSSPGKSAIYPCTTARRDRPPVTIAIALGGEVVFWVSILIGLPLLTFRKLKKEQSKMSTRAYQVQKTLLVSLVVQVSMQIWLAVY